MAAFLAQFQQIKSSSERLIVAIEDVSDLWPIVKEGFEARVPFRKACLNNKARNSFIVDELPVEYILTTDSRLRSRLPQEQSPFWFRQPFATVVLVTCEDFDEYKTILRPRVRSIIQNEDREWFIVFVSKAHLATDQAGKLTKRIYSKLEVDFSSKKRERCCKLDMHVADAAFWEDVESKTVECIRFTLDRRVQVYEEEIRKLSENRIVQARNFCNFFIMKESLAFMFEMVHMQEDALREYDELEQSYMELVITPTMKQKDFGGLDPGDDCAALLDASRKLLSQIASDEFLREFDFRQYLFACEALLLFQLNRPVEVAARGFSFIISFSKVLSEHEKNLPFCFREVWVITACMFLVKETAEKFTSRLVKPDAEKEFYRLQADLYSLARVKLMRLADLTGFGKNIEKSPCNSASLSMLPWPKPDVWPSVPPDAASRILAKEQVAEEKPRPFGIVRKPLPLAPTMLLRDANRRRASLSAGNLPELLESRVSFKESPAAEGAHLVSPPRLVPASPARVNSAPLHPVSPGSAGSSPARAVIDRPMRLPEIHAAAEYALHKTITNARLGEALSSVDGFEELYLELTRAAADNYHRSWRKRHGVVLDGEVAALHYRRGNYDSAAKLYEKVCALYSGEGWHALLAEVLPHLAECQKQLGDLPGYLQSCVKLLSLEKRLLLEQERHTLQSEVLRLAHSALKNPVSLDVSALITFSGRGGPPLELCEGDPGNLSVSVWSGFPGEISLDALSLTLIATFTADEGVKVVKSADAPVLKPGKNSVLLVLPPQRPGSYVLGVLTGQLGQVRLRSHTYCTTSAVSSKGGSPESDDFLSLEKPLRPVLQVSKPRPLIDITSVVSWGLLMGELQWLGLMIKPINYSLKGAVLFLSAGHGLHLEDPQVCELELLNTTFKSSISKLNAVAPLKSYVSASVANAETKSENGGSVKCLEDKRVLDMKDGKVSLPDWAKDKASVLWLQVRAVQDGINTARTADAQHSAAPSSPGTLSNVLYGNGTVINDITSSSLSSGSLPSSQENGQHQANISHNSESTGVRKIDLRLEFGAGRGRVYERTVTVQFLEPLRTITRIVTKGNDSTILLQVSLVSQLNAAIIIVDAHLDLQPGYIHVGDTNGRPSPGILFPLVMAASSESALMFLACLEASSIEDGNKSPLHRSNHGSTLSIHYNIIGDRAFGAHSPFKCFTNVNHEPQEQRLLFKSSIFLQMPVLEPILAVGMLPLPSENPRVGEQFIIQWKVERLKEGCVRFPQKDVQECTLETSTAHTEDLEELFYEISINSDNWMIAGRNKGYIFLSSHLGGHVLISMACVPLAAGYVRPPSLGLPHIDKAKISCTPAGPHLICVLPPALCSSFCITQTGSKATKG